MFTAMFGIRTPSGYCVGQGFAPSFFRFASLCCSVFPVLPISKMELINYWPLDGDAIDGIGKHDGEVIGGISVDGRNHAK